MPDMPDFYIAGMVDTPALDPGEPGIPVAGGMGRLHALRFGWAQIHISPWGQASAVASADTPGRTTW